MSDKPSTDRAPDAPEHELYDALATLSGRYGAYEPSILKQRVMRAWREAVREQVRQMLTSDDGVLSAPAPAVPADTPDDSELAQRVTNRLAAWGVRQPEVEPLAMASEIIALVRQHDARVPAQPAPVAQGDEEWIRDIAQIVASVITDHGPTETRSLIENAIGAAREIHAHYERRAAQQRERYAEVVDVLTEMLDGYRNGATGTYRQKLVTRCKAALAALAKPEAAHD